MANRTGIKAGKAYVTINAIDNVTKTFKHIQRSALVFAGQMRNIGRQMTMTGILAGAGVVYPITQMIKAASDFAESMNFFNEVYGDNADAVRDWSYETAAAMNRSKASMIDLMSRAGSIFGQLDLDKGDATELAKIVSQIAIDYASLRNLPDDRAFQQIISAIQGRPVSLSLSGGATILENMRKEFAKERFGIVNDAAVDQTTKTLMRLLMVIDKMKEASGDAVRTARYFANALKSLGSTISDAAVAAGQKFLPAATAVVELIRDAAKNATPFFRDNIVQITVALLGATAAVTLFGLAMFAIGTGMLIMMPPVMMSLTAITLALNIASAAASVFFTLMGMGPVGVAAAWVLLGVAVVAAIEAGTTAIWLMNGGFTQVANNVKSVVGPALIAFFGTLKSMIDDIALAVMNGQIEVAFKMVVTGLQMAWTAGIMVLKNLWLEFENWLLAKVINLASKLGGIGGVLQAAGVDIGAPAADYLLDTELHQDANKAENEMIQKLLQAKQDVLRALAEEPADQTVEDWASRRLEDMQAIIDKITARLTPDMFTATSAGGAASNIGGLAKGSAEETRRVNNAQRKDEEMARKQLDELMKQTKFLETIEANTEEEGVTVGTAAGA